MNDSERDEMNQKLDTLFDQIDKLQGDERIAANNALFLWKTAKDSEFLGLGPMESKSCYKYAYSTLRDMGLEVGGMIKPYESSSEA